MSTRKKTTDTGPDTTDQLRVGGATGTPENEPTPGGPDTEGQLTMGRVLGEEKPHPDDVKPSSKKD